MTKLPLVLLFLFSLAGPARSGEAEDPAILEISEAEVVLRVPAWSEALAGGRVVVLEPDFLHLAGYDARSGKLAWRRRFQDEANGTHDLHIVGDRLFAWAGNRIHVVNPRSGRVLVSYSAPWQGGDSRCSLEHWDGVCSFRCECQLYLFDCGSGKQLGKRYNKSYVEFHDMDGTSSGGCYGTGGGVVGRAGDTVVVVVEDEKSEAKLPRMGRSLVTIGLDAKTGEERWRLGGWDPGSYSWFSGVSRDGSTGFLADEFGEARVFSCRDGKILFEHGSYSSLPEPHEKKEKLVAWLDEPPGLFLMVGETAELIDGRTGRARWKKTGLGEQAVAIPLGIRLGPYDLYPYGEPADVRFLDPVTGEERGTVAIGKHGRLMSDGRGGYVAFDWPLRTYDPAGKMKSQVEVPGRMGNLRMVAGMFVLSGQESGMILDAERLGILGRIRGSCEVAGMDSSAPRGTLLLHGFSPERGKIGEAVLLRASLGPDPDSLKKQIRKRARGLNPKVLDLALKAAGAARKRGIGKKEILTIVDYSLPSTRKRLWVIDLKDGRVLFHELVAHGKGTGDNRARTFSNRPETLASSLGLFETLGTYEGKHGYSLKLKGLEKGTNDNAEQRAIVVHGAWYVSAEFARKHGRLGRSWGCPALDKRIATKVIDALKDGSLLFVYHPDQNWLSGSDFLK